ncbi:hypothetical protein [Miltoncostaea marina]|uniref:hypothetical protein n=1 Tax=Miltoncostaea marina TaxID=2843215 RepID=UPI001C3C487A|nr:hypothetical protein [Miltoncostaea marina]
MRSERTRRAARRAALLCCAGAAMAAGAAAPPALADDAADARASMADAVEAAVPVPQATARPLPRPSGGRLRAVTASAVFGDALGDSLLAPDLTTMMPFTSDDGRYTVAIGLDTNALVEGDAVTTFVNADGNPATGSPTFDGADVAVSIIGQTGTDAVGATRWSGVDWQPVSSGSLIGLPSGATDVVWSMAAGELGVLPGTPTTLHFGSIYQGYYDDYFDFAPEPGLAPFAFTAGAAAPPAAAPVAAPPAAGPAPAAAGTGAVRPPAAQPLVVRSFALTRRGGAIRARIGWARGAGRVVWTLRLRARADGRTATRTVRGAGAAGTRVVTRTVRVPRAWAGARVTATLTVRDASRTLTRSRSLRA